MRLVSVVLSLVCVATACGARDAAGRRSMPITTASTEARQLFEQARDLLENIEPDAAAMLLDQAVAKDPDFAMAHVLRAEAGGFAAARGHLDEAVRLAGRVSPAERHWILAAQAGADDDAAALAAHVEALLAAYPDDKHVQLLAGSYQRNTVGDESGAIRHFSNAVAIDPAHAPAYNGLGYAQAATGDVEGAEASFKQYIALLPNRPNPYDSYAEFLMKRGRFDESIAEYRHALQKDSTFPAAHTGIGANLIFKGDFEGARAAFRQQFAVATRPVDKLAAVRNLAHSYVYEDRVTDAVRAFDEVAAIARAHGLIPTVIGAQYDGAVVLSEFGHADQAAERLAAARTELESASLPESVMTRLRIVGDLLEIETTGRKGHLVEADAALTRPAALVTERRNPFEAQHLQAARGMLALRQGRHVEAADLFAQAGSHNPQVLYYRAIALERAGRTSDAASLYQQVASWNQHSLAYALVRTKARTVANR